MNVRPLADEDRPALRALLEEAWGLPVVSISDVYDDPSPLPGFVAEDDGDTLGYLTYRIVDKESEVLTINAVVEGKGPGKPSWTRPAPPRPTPVAAASGS